MASVDRDVGYALIMGSKVYARTWDKLRLNPILDEALSCDFPRAGNSQPQFVECRCTPINPALLLQVFQQL